MIFFGKLAVQKT